ncbi:40S ribosomal protein S8 [Vitis vinifera]|uniref:40S ribosomal protein S8 n=1 Tax=Vitis vinifera TaxID=29760 RepID=A0A438HFK2_VITVI|nr:40S ribosomal protein S8 [Vitis vinifera]
MGISRDSMHKRRATGGKKKAWRKKRKYELGRQPANTKLSSNKTVRRVRVRGGNVKWRALRLDTGNYSWGSEAVTRKTRGCSPIQAMVSSALWVDIGRKKKTTAKKETTESLMTMSQWLPGLALPVALSNHSRSPPYLHPWREKVVPQRKQRRVTMFSASLRSRQQDHKLDPHIEEQFGSGRLLASISSRPGQCGRADGYILEGKELEFYIEEDSKEERQGQCWCRLIKCASWHNCNFEKHPSKMEVFGSDLERIRNASYDLKVKGFPCKNQVFDEPLKVISKNLENHLSDS